MAHTELNLRERRRIEDMLNAKIPVREIAAEIGRHVSTVYRDIKRNGYTDEKLPELNGYYGIVAQKAATQVISPFLMGSSRRIQVAVFSFMAGVMPPIPILGRSLL